MKTFRAIKIKKQWFVQVKLSNSNTFRQPTNYESSSRADRVATAMNVSQHVLDTEWKPVETK